MLQIENLINSPVSIKYIIQFANYIRKSLQETVQSIPVSVRVLLLPCKCNAFTHIKISKAKNKRKATIVLNLTPFILNRYSSDKMCYFFLCVSILHEIEHIKILTDLSDKEHLDYHRVFAGLEQICVKRSAFAHFLQPLFSKVKDVFKLARKRYNTSLAELICDYESILATKGMFLQYLSDTELQAVDAMLESISHTINSLEISYYSSGKPCSQFLRILNSTQRKIKNKNLLDSIPQLKALFCPDGTIKPIEDIVELAYRNNTELYTEFLIRYFIFTDYNWDDVFGRNEDYKAFIEKLANKYCDMGSNFLVNSSRCELYLEEEIIRDNSAMIIKNVDRLNKLMKKYGMKHSGKTISPLYKVY